MIKSHWAPGLIRQTLSLTITREIANNCNLFAITKLDNIYNPFFSANVLIKVLANQIGGRIGQEGERKKSYSAAVIDGIKRNTTIYVGDCIIRKTDSRLSKGEDVVVCLPGARIEHVTERVEKIVGRGNGGTILVHVGTNNTDKEGTTAIVEKYRKLLKKTKQARLGQIILSGI